MKLYEVRKRDQCDLRGRYSRIRLPYDSSLSSVYTVGVE